MNKVCKRMLMLAIAAVIAIGFTAPVHADVDMDDTRTVRSITVNWFGYQMQIPVYTYYYQSFPQYDWSQDDGYQNNGSQGQTGTKTPQQPAESNKNVNAEVQAIVDLVNAERAKAGLKPVTLNTELSHMAAVKARDMRDNHYFSHNSPIYGSPFEMMKSFGIQYSYAGENIAAGQRTPEEVMEDWMNSPGHRANILNPNFTEIGVGVAKGGSYGTYWVQEFIRP